MAFRKILGYKVYSRMGAGTPSVPPYTPVKWVKGTGSAIDTGIKPTINTEVYFELFIPSRNSGTYQSFEFGARVSATSAGRIALYYNTAAGATFIPREWAYRFGNKQTDAQTTPNGGAVNTYRFNKDGSWFNGNLVQSLTGVTFTQENLNLYLMGVNNNGVLGSPSDTFYGWISAYIKDGDVLLRDFKAAKDNDGKYCFYDLVSKQFFYPISGNLTGEDLP